MTTQFTHIKHSHSSLHLTLISVAILSSLSLSASSKSDLNSDVNNLYLNSTSTIVHASDLKNRTNNSQSSDNKQSSSSDLKSDETTQHLSSLIAQSNLPHLKLNSVDMAKHLHVKQADIPQLCLDSAYDTAQQNLSTELASVLKNSNKVSHMSDSDIISYLNSNQYAIMLGLAYYNRYFNVHFNSTDLKSVLETNPSLYGKQIDPLDLLIYTGNRSFTDLKPVNNYTTSGIIFRRIANVRNTTNFLKLNQMKFANNYKDTDNWFKASTPAYIKEQNSSVIPDAKSVEVWQQLTKYPRYYKYILPLLNLKSDAVWLAVQSNSIVFGNYDKYIDLNLKQNNLSEYKSEQAKVHQQIDHYVQMWQNYYDTWYKITDNKGRENFLKSQKPVYDGYRAKDSTAKGGYKWLASDDKASSMYDFYSMLGDWYRPNGSEAYANGNLVHIVAGSILSDYDTSTLTHEQTHNYDGSVYFNGYGRRPGQGAEEFAMGLLQSPRMYNDNYGFNLVFDWSKNSNRGSRLHNMSYSRFQSASDLSQYQHNLNQLTNLLDAAEGQQILKLKPEQRQLFWRTISETKSGDSVSKELPLSTASELKSVDDLVNRNIVDVAYSGNNFSRNSYANVYLTKPIYAGLISETSPGGLMFRKTAFDLLGCYGWQNGFLPYVSAELKSVADKEHKPLTDKFIFNTELKNSNSNYKSYADLKKDQYNSALKSAQKDSWKTLRISYNHSMHDINSYQSLSDLMSDAVTKDAALLQAKRKPHYVTDLKSALIATAHRVTSDLRTPVLISVKDNHTPDNKQDKPLSDPKSDTNKRDNNQSVTNKSASDINSAKNNKSKSNQQTDNSSISDSNSDANKAKPTTSHSSVSDINNSNKSKPVKEDHQSHLSDTNISSKDRQNNQDKQHSLSDLNSDTKNNNNKQIDDKSATDSKSDTKSNNNKDNKQSNLSDIKSDTENNTNKPKDNSNITDLNSDTENNNKLFDKPVSTDTNSETNDSAKQIADQNKRIQDIINHAENADKKNNVSDNKSNKNNNNNNSSISDLISDKKDNQQNKQGNKSLSDFNSDRSNNKNKDNKQTSSDLNPDKDKHKQQKKNINNNSDFISDKDKQIDKIKKDINVSDLNSDTNTKSDINIDSNKNNKSDIKSDIEEGNLMKKKNIDNSDTKFSNKNENVNIEDDNDTTSGIEDSNNVEDKNIKDNNVTDFKSDKNKNGAVVIGKDALSNIKKVKDGMDMDSYGKTLPDTGIKNRFSWIAGIVGLIGIGTMLLIGKKRKENR